MKVFADTNFLISAFVSRGLSHDIFKLVIAKHELILGEFVLNEFCEKMESKIKVPPSEIEEFVSFLRSFQVVPIPPSGSTIRLRDEDDEWVLSSALAAKADVLITGDKDLLDVASEINQILILSPRGFWEYLVNV